jgi:hypothetical protein
MEFPTYSKLSRNQVHDYLEYFVVFINLLLVSSIYVDVCHVLLQSVG